MGRAGRAPAPRTEQELLERAVRLRGRALQDIAAAAGGPLLSDGVRTKGKAGELIEWALGATGGSARARDFPELGVELKTIPVVESGQVRESSYVCTLPLEDADRVEWETSWVRTKLARVLWVPLVGDEKRVGEALLWSPTQEQDRVLRSDFEDAMGAIALGHVEALTAHSGRWLQVRPKAKDGSVRTHAWGRDGERIATVPRGFYLRAIFTAAILEDPSALP